MKYAVVTKSLLVLAVGTIFLLGFGLVPIYSLTLNWFGVWHKFELWRLVTSGATLGHPSLSVRTRFFFFFFENCHLLTVAIYISQALMNLLMLYQYSVRLEKDMFDAGGGGGSADYLWMLIFSQALLCAANVLYFDMPITSSSLILSIVYVWSRKVSRLVFCFFRFVLTFMPFTQIRIRMAQPVSGELPFSLSKSFAFI